MQIIIISTSFDKSYASTMESEHRLLTPIPIPISHSSCPFCAMSSISYSFSVHHYI